LVTETSLQSADAREPMDRWVCAGSLDDLWDGEIRGVRLETVDVVLCHVGGNVFAYDDRCPHLGNSLANGSLDEHRLTCAAHEWSFDMRDGRGINPADACLRRYAVRIVDDAVWVNVRSRDT
jgi:toluene monooxygenase system ferredoxin subunit